MNSSPEVVVRSLTKPAWLIVAVLSVVISSRSWAQSGDDVPWESADRQTILVIQVDLERLAVEDLGATLQALAGDRAEESWIGRAKDWLGQLKGAGAERVGMAFGPPFDDVGEDQDVPIWAAIRHKPSDASKVKQAIEQMGKDVQVELVVGDDQGRWTSVWIAGQAPDPHLAAERVAEFRHALREARGGAITAALILPATRKAWLAERLGEFSELVQGPVRESLRRASDAVQNWRFATAGIWLGPNPRLRVEFLFETPTGANELARTVERIREYFTQQLRDLPADSPDRPKYEARSQLSRVRMADCQVVWELEPEQLSWVRTLIFPTQISSKDPVDSNQ